MRQSLATLRRKKACTLGSDLAFCDRLQLHPTNDIWCAMVLAAGIVGFILGVNLGFLFAGLMRAAKEKDEQTEDENKTC